MPPIIPTVCPRLTRKEMPFTAWSLLFSSPYLKDTLSKQTAEASSAVSFSVSVTVNYILSMAFVFKSKKQSKVKEFIIFVLLSIGGLGLNQLILWIGVTFTSIYYLVVKFLAMVIVPIYNFITRKIFLEAKEK